MRKATLLCAIALAAFCSAPQAWGLNIIRPGDTIIPIDTTTIITTGSRTPASGLEEAPNILDGNIATKYLNFGITNTGFIVTPGTAGALQSLVITTANDAIERDPKSVRIYGTNSPITSVAHSQGNSESWTEITVDPLTFDLPLTRQTAGAPINITNGTTYASYKVIFPEVRDVNNMGETGTANSMQIADVSFYTGANATGTSMLSPTDFIIPIRDQVATVSPSQSNSPAGEPAANSIDRNSGTKYLNFGELDSGVIVTPAIGPSIATGFKITTANDAPERDPTSYAIYGTNEAITTQPHEHGTENNWVLISQGTITPPDARFTESEEITFANNQAYTSYRITFPTVRDAAAANSMQVAEIFLTAQDAATLVVNRQTGEVRIRADQNVSFSGYQLESLINGLNPDGWNSIAATNGDPNDTWTETSTTAQLLAEEDLPTGSNNGISLTAGSFLSLGNAWQSLPVTYENGITFSLFGLDGSLIADGVEFEGTEIPLGDYSGNGTVGPEDWPLFRAGLGGNYQGMSISEAYLGGDLDGDFDSDINDFNLFVAKAGGFAALFGNSAAVPEPSSMLLIGIAVAGGIGFRYRKRQLFGSKAAVLVAVVAAVLIGSTASAQQFTNVGGSPGQRGQAGSVTSPDISENETSGPEQWFDDDYLDDAGVIDGELFVTDYNLPHLAGEYNQYAGQGAAPKTVFIDYNSPVSANWFAYAQRSGADPTADRVGKFEFWFSNSPFNDTLPATPADAVVTIAPTDDRLFDSALRPYSLQGTKTGQYVAIRLTVSEVSASRPTNNIGGHEFRLLSGPSDVVLEVNRATGEMILRNNGPMAQNIDMQAITIESASGGLNAAGYNGVRGDSGFPVGTGTGNGWEIGGGSNIKRIVETYFNGESTLAAGTTGISLGTGYNPLSLAEDLTFRWTTSFVYTSPTTGESRPVVEMFDGIVTYVGTAPDILPGDYNDDGTVDAADYVVWRNNLGTTNVLLNDSTPGSVDIDDYERWKLNYGKEASGALAVSAAAVPEPHSIVLSLLLTVVGATAIRRRLG